MLREEHDSSHRRLRGVLGEFTAAIATYLRLAQSLTVGSGSGKTKLDKFRLKMCKTQLVRARTLSCCVLVWEVIEASRNKRSVSRFP